MLDWFLGGGAGALRQAGDLQHRSGSQFTGSDFAGGLQAYGTRISINGRSLKCEAVYPHAIADAVAARRVIGRWVTFDNAARPHSDLDGQTPAEAYETGLLHMMDKADALPPPPQAQEQ